MNPIVLIKLSLLCLVASVTFHPAEAFEVRNEADYKKIFTEDAKVSKPEDGFGFTEGPALKTVSPAAKASLDQQRSAPPVESKAGKAFAPVEILPSSYLLARQITIRTASSRIYIGTLRNGKLDFVEQSNPGSTAQLLAALDVTGDQAADLLFRDDVDVGDFGVVKAWNKFSRPSEAIVRSVNRAWRVEAVGDMDGDGFEDLVWRYTKPGTNDTGVSYIWFMNGNRVTQVRKRGGAPLSWRLLGALDVNFDGSADLIYL
jgi:hypothetical protein